VVHSEQPYPWPVSAVLRRPIASLAAFVLLAAVAAGLPRAYRILWRRRIAADAPPWPGAAT
jgi:hypothetical protein